MVHMPGRMACLLLLGVCLRAQVSDAGYAKALDGAEKFFSQGDMDGVIRTLTPWVEKLPNQPEGYHGLGLAYYQQKNFAGAIQHLSRAIQLEKRDSAAWRQTVEILAMAYYFSNRSKDALPLLEKAAAWNAGNTNLHYTLAMCYLHAHDRTNAVRSFADLFRIPAEGVQALQLTADLMIQESYSEDAEILIHEALKKKPGLREANYRLGVIALGRGDYAKAVEYLQKELADNPSHSLAWHWLGDAYIRMGKFEEAVEPLQRSIWLNLRAARSYVLLASVYVQQARFLVAENALRRAIEMEPQNREAHFLLGRVYYKTNRAEAAKQEMEVAEKLGPAGEKR